MTFRAAKRRALIAAHLGGHLNRGPLGSTIAFKTDGDDDDAGKTVVLEEGAFQKQVIDSMAKAETQIKTYGDKIEELTTKIDEAPKELKKYHEDLTKLKKVANDQQANLEAFTRKLGEFDNLLRQQVRHHYGSAIKRVQADEEMRLRLNAIIRLRAGKDSDDMRSIIAKGFPADFVKRALGEDTSPGSTLVNQQLLNELYNTLEEYGIWNTFHVVRLGTKTNILPVKTARAVALALTEGTQIGDDGNKAGTTVTATVVLIAALLNVYLTLIQDAEFDVTADVLDDFAQATAYRLDWFCTQADGTADTTDGSMTGIFGGGGTTVTAAAGNIHVEDTSEADWRNALLGVDAAVLQRMAKWWMHPQILVRALAVKDGNGRSIFQTALEAPAPGKVGSIYGYPIVLGAACPTTNAASAKVAAFGDPAGQVVGIRNDFEIATSDDFKFDYYMRSFRVVGRAATKIRKAGAFTCLTLPAA